MKKDKERFEDHLGRVEASIKALEGGDLGLEDALVQYEEGIRALRKCYEILEGAEQRIQILLKNEAGELAPRPFDEKAAAEPEPDSPSRARPTQPKASAADSDELPF